MRNSVVRSMAAFLALAAYGCAYSSLTIGPGLNTATMKVPAVTPFTSLGDYRVEFRIHDWSAASGQRVFSWGSTYGSGLYLEIRLTAVGEICAVNYVDYLSRGQFACADVTGRNDVFI